jgi:hypothetical protein
LRIERAGTAHGFLAGFDRTVGDGIRLSNRPDAPEREQSANVYDTVFFPWLEPVTLDVGDTVVLDLRAMLLGDDYVWTWRSRICGVEGALKGSFTQSSFLGTPLSRDTLQRHGKEHVPRINDEGRIARFILAGIEEGVPIGQIAARLAAEFPARLTARDALNRVTALSALYD